MRPIRKSRVQKTGIVLAVGGLSLALVVGGAAAANAYTYVSSFGYNDCGSYYRPYLEDVSRGAGDLLIWDGYIGNENTYPYTAANQQHVLVMQADIHYATSATISDNSLLQSHVWACGY